MCECVYVHASVCTCLTMYKYAMLNPFSIASTQHFTADHFGLNDHSDGHPSGRLFLTLVAVFGFL